MGQSNRSGVTFGWHAPEHFGRSPHEGRATALSGMGGRSNHVRLEVPPVVYNQHSVGRCVAEALAFCAELLAARAGYRRERPDRTSLYWRIRSAIGTTGEDSGGTIADGVAALQQRRQVAGVTGVRKVDFIVQAVRGVLQPQSPVSGPAQ